MKVLAILSVNPDFQEFGIPELKSILRRTNIPLKVLLKHQIQQFPEHDYQINYKSFKNYPFILLNIPDFEQHKPYLIKAALNGVMLTKLVQIISYGGSYEEMYEKFDTELVKREFDNWDTRIYCQFYSRNRTIGRQQQRTKITNIFKSMNICGKVDLETPEKILCIAEDHNWFINHHHIESKETLKTVYFGIELSSNRSLLNGPKFNLKYELTNRIYLGPTSTDNDLSFLMCHQGLIDQTSFVLDPFAGTGSLLIPPSHYGAYVFGSDLDIRVLNGYSVGQINKRCKYYDKEKQLQIFTPKIMLNFKQYDLKQPEIFRMDCLKGRFRAKEMFDAIICDPPYGLRAMSRKIHQKNKKGEEKGDEKEEHEQIKQQVKGEQQIKQAQVQNQTKQVKQVSQQVAEQTKQQEGQNQNIDQEEKDLKKAAYKKQLKKRRKQNKKQRNLNLTTQQKQFKQKINHKFTEEMTKKWINKPNIEVIPKDQIYNGLLNFASEYLKEDGYLVFLYPILLEENFQGTGDELPKHPQFELVDFSSQKMKEGNVRILVTMRKLIKQQKI